MANKIVKGCKAATLLLFMFYMIYYLTATLAGNDVAAINPNLAVLTVIALLIRPRDLFFWKDDDEA